MEIAVSFYFFPFYHALYTRPAPSHAAHTRTLPLPRAQIYTALSVLIASSLSFAHFAQRQSGPVTLFTFHSGAANICVKQQRRRRRKYQIIGMSKCARMSPLAKSLFRTCLLHVCRRLFPSSQTRFLSPSSLSFVNPGLPALPTPFVSPSLSPISLLLPIKFSKIPTRRCRDDRSSRTRCTSGYSTARQEHSEKSTALEVEGRGKEPRP